ncbi:MAG: phage capsid protein [Parvibaculum sp.]|uniref:phage capsid protein n=1 Tax=Parvibaculum sp. TaxID=2024848 RepID=UPI00271B3800|nr:phage capsid protein [Parvibaculum sp.]MDO8839653.1 phage capsid protein [Parvibaculum sp.]
MSNMTVSPLGQANLAGASDALFLKVFGGEVLTAFNETEVMSDKHIVRTIEHGKSAQFPATWKANAAYHTPGNQILGANQIRHGERTISIDDLLVADTFIASIDEAKNHYDVRSIYSAQLGAALARAYDTKLLQVAILAARASAVVTGAFGGSAITDADARTNGESLAGSIFDAAQVLDEKDVPENDRYAIVKPAQYYLLAQTTKVLNKDWNGAGSYSDGKITRISDIVIVKSNNLPQGVVAGASGENNTYSGTFTNVAAAVFQKSAVGTVKLMDLAVQKTADDGDFATMYQGTLMVAKYAMGHGLLRPECAVEVKIA